MYRNKLSHTRTMKPPTLCFKKWRWIFKRESFFLSSVKRNNRLDAFVRISSLAEAVDGFWLFEGGSKGRKTHTHAHGNPITPPSTHIWSHTCTQVKFPYFVYF